MTICPDCGANQTSGQHVCAPSWFCWVPDGDDTLHDAIKIHAVDAEAAAQAFVEKWDAETGRELWRDGEMTLPVSVSNGAGSCLRFIVTGKHVPTFTVHRG
jgi:hypothetical protein